MEQTITPKDAKNMAITNQAIELLTNNPNLSMQQIADTLEISRPTLYNHLKGEYAQEALRRELNEGMARVNNWIEQNINHPTNPSNSRTAAKLQQDINKNLIDKTYATKKETLNVNVNIDIEQLQSTEKLLEETLSRLPQQTYDTFTRTWKQIEKEWGWTTTPSKTNP